MPFFDEINDTDWIMIARRYVLEVPIFDEINDTDWIMIARK